MDTLFLAKFNGTPAAMLDDVDKFECVGLFDTSLRKCKTGRTLMSLGISNDVLERGWCLDRGTLASPWR